MDYHVTWRQIADGLYCIQSASNTYAIVADNEAILFDFGAGITAETFYEMGIERIHSIYLTSHDRTSSCGIVNIPDVRVFASEGTCDLLDNAETIWSVNDQIRYHMVDFEPQKNIPCSNINTSGTVIEDYLIIWNGWTIQVVNTPGFSKHDVSYLLSNDHITYCVCGKLLYKGGRINELYLLQQGHDAQVCGYHGFMEGLPSLRKSLDKIKSADMLLPVYGDTEDNPAKAIDAFIDNSTNYMRLYSEVSALNFYFPDYLGSNTDYEPAFRAQSAPLPDFIQYIPGTTSFVIISKDKAAFVVDCSMTNVLSYLDKKCSAGEISTVDFCWVSHYHHDHVEEINALTAKYNCAVYADDSFADILRYPKQYYLTCLSERAANVTPVSHHTKKQWHEFTLTFYHFPGQTLYHGGLLLEGYGLKVFFSGDSFAPTGFDDYCAWNRNFLREDAGYFQCLDLLENIKPDIILNQHQSEGFVYTADQYKYLRNNLIKRKEILNNFVCENIDESFDPLAVRCMPYGAEVYQGTQFDAKVYYTGHREKTYKALAEPWLPDGWSIQYNSRLTDVYSSSGLDCDDACQNFVIGIPENATGRYAIPFHVSVDGKYKGLLCHMLVDVRENKDQK